MPENDRFWVNWVDNEYRPKGVRVGYVALVDENQGGEIAFFPNEDMANMIAEMLNFAVEIDHVFNNGVNDNV